MNFVTERLAIGDANDVQRHRGLYDAVLNMAAEIHDSVPVPYLHVKLDDCVPAEESDLLEAFDFLDRQLAADRTVLVHCLAGVSRSVSVVCGYLAFRTGEPIHQILARVRILRPQANPDPDLFDSVAAFVERRKSS